LRKSQLSDIIVDMSFSCIHCAEIFDSSEKKTEHYLICKVRSENLKCSCEHCGREFKNQGSLRLHIASHKSCKICGKKFQGRSASTSLKSHLQFLHTCCTECDIQMDSREELIKHYEEDHPKARCFVKNSGVTNSRTQLNKQGDLVYICNFCNYETSNKQSYCAHRGHCKKNPNRRTDDPFKDTRAWAKGFTKDTHPSLAAASAKSKGRKIPPDKIRRGFKQSEEAKRKQSETRKRKYAEGTLTPAKGVGQGNGGRVNGIYLRSSYEIIMARYLYKAGIDFEYETVRVQFNDKTWISDFKVGNVLYEVYGWQNKKPVVEAFENAGYEICLIGPDEIQLMAMWLSKEEREPDCL
jgi:hypothetical protein